MEFRYTTKPGPVIVSERILKAMSSQPISHRSNEMRALYKNVTGGLRRLLYLDDRHLAFAITASGSGFYDLIATNLIAKGESALVVEIGAFGEKFSEALEAYHDFGFTVKRERLEWGTACTREQLESALERHKPDILCLTHIETSTGVQNPLEKLSEAVREYREKKELLWCVDSVSAMGGVELRPSELKADLVFASSQKCLGIPPGIAVGCASREALKKAEKISRRGHYFSLPDIVKLMEKLQTPSTPAVNLMNALNAQLKHILDEETLEKRFSRHKRLAGTTREWAKKHKNLAMLNTTHPAHTVSCIRHDETLDRECFKKKLMEKGIDADMGYRKLAERIPNFRIAHMGDLTEKNHREILRTYSESM